MDKRVDRYDVEWQTVEACGDILEHVPSFRYATITIHELWSIGHIIFPKEPLKVEGYFADEKDEDQSALVVYDFGMDDRISVTKDKNWIYNYSGGNEECLPIKSVFSTVKFDLMHAFFHFNGDPNYTHRHWALYGNLKDRVTADESFLYED